MELLKKDVSCEWNNECQIAFDELKEAMMNDPILALLDVMKPFEVQTDASDFTLVWVLLPDDHPIAYENRKLLRVERN